MGDLVRNNNFSAYSRAFETDAMEELLEQGARDNGMQSKFLTKKSFAPSGIGYGSGTCARRWVLSFRGANFIYDSTARQIANMDAGTAAGERIANQFKSAGILNGAEFPIRYDDPPIFGYGDLAVTWQGEQMIGEVKTTKTESFQTRAASMKPPGYQLIQLLLYMYIMKKDKGFFYIEDKNTHEVLIIPIKMTQEHLELVERTLEWARTVRAAFETGELPNRPFTKGSAQCKSCPVRGDCWDGYVKGTAKREGQDPNPSTIDIDPLVIPK